jgi:hypothetical protein
MRVFKNFQRRSQSFLGIFTLICGFFMMWNSVRAARDDSRALETVASQAIVIDPLVPRSSDNGALVLVAARFSSVDQLEDEYLKAGPYLILRRRVEMYQWIEEENPLLKKKEYRLGWHEGQVDFFNFAETRGHENPLLTIAPDTKKVQSAAFGAFDGRALINAVERLLPLSLTPDLLKDSAAQIENDRILIRRDPSNSNTTPSLGDVRVWYDALPQGDYTVLTKQIDERNLLGSRGGESVVVRQGLLSLDDFKTSEARESKDVAGNLLYLGAVLLCAGLYSILSPLAGSFDLRPRFQLRGHAAVVFVSVGVSILLTLILMIVGKLG